jgi:uncharacterized protein YoxC
MWQNIGRILIVVVAIAVIVLCVGGIFGAWGVSSAVSNFTLKIFSVIQGGVQVVDTAAGRVDTLIQTARTEVQQTADSINTAASNLQENRPVLTALNERLETRLGPTVDKVQETLAPVQDVLVSVSSAVNFANSIPFISERAPRLDQLDQTLTKLSSLGADVKQLRTTLNAVVTEQADRLTQSVATALTDLTTRIDGGLANIQSEVQALQAELAALQSRLQTLQSVLLLVFNLIALLATLLYIWVIYSQVVVIRHHWVRSNNSASAPVAAEPHVPVVAEPIAAQLPLPIEAETAAQPAVDAAPDQPEKSH